MAALRSSILVSTWQRLSPPAAITPAACVRSAGFPCAACADACPNEAIELASGGAARVSAADCTSCGACIPACPTAAISGGHPDVRHTESACYLTCDQAGGATPCLVAVTPEDILSSLRATDRRIELYTANCQDCPIAPAAQVETSVAQLRGALQVAGLPQPVSHLTDVEPPARSDRSVTMNRRQLLAVLPPTPTPGPAAPAGALERRETFIGALGHRAWHPLYPRPIAASDDRGRSVCTACRACLPACPARALSAVDLGASFELSVEPSACVGCGICVQTCPVDALALACDRMPPNPVIARVYAAHCERCDRPLHPGETRLCTSCDSREAIAADVFKQLGW